MAPEMMYWVLAVSTIIGGIAGVWFFWDKIEGWCRRKPQPLPEMQVGRKMAEEMGLEAFLRKSGYRLFWGDVREREYYLRFGDYERIEWPDAQGKVWLLVPAPGDDLPLKTTYAPEEIERRRESRKKRSNEVRSS
jgi:hypothetical protein